MPRLHMVRLFLRFLLFVYVASTLIGFIYVRKTGDFLTPQTESHTSDYASRTLEKNRTSRGIDIKISCQPVPLEALKRAMGPAFNPRYMSIHKPEEELSERGKTVGTSYLVSDHNVFQKRESLENFHVYPRFTKTLYDEPAQFTLRNNDQNLPLPVTEEKDIKQLPRFEYEDVGENRTVENSSYPEVTFRNTKAVKEMPSEKFLKLVRRRKRSGTMRWSQDLFWKCESHVEWVDLGANHFPRFLRNVVCLGRCWFGHFTCRGKAFTVKILERRNDSCISSSFLNFDSNANEHVQSEQWVFQERAVTSCCECSY